MGKERSSSAGLVLIGLLVLLFGCKGKGSGSRSAWTHFKPGEGGTLTALAVHPSDSRILLAGTMGGIFRSRDGGQNWARVGMSLAGNEITRIRFNPSDPSIVLVGTRRQGLFKSLDGGGIFSARNGDLPAGKPDRWVTALDVDPVNPQLLYLGLDGQGVFRSMDGGQTWSLKVLGLISLHVNDLKVFVLNPLTLFAATDKGVFRSENGGDSWVGLTASLDMQTILPHPTIKDLLVAAGRDGVWRSTDNGQIWTRFENGLPPSPGPGLGTARTIAHDSENPLDLYLSGLEGVWRAHSGQNSWEEINTGLGTEKNRVIGPFAVVGQGPLVGPVLHAGVNGEGYFQSSSGGLSWAGTGRGLDAVSVRAVAVFAANADIVYMGTPGRVWRSLDGGATWGDASGTLQGPARSIRDLWVDPGDHKLVIAATDAGVFWTGNSGGDWNASQGSGPVRALAVHPGGGTHSLIVAVGEAGVYRSEDRGHVFTLIASGQNLVNLRDIAIDPSDPDFMFTVREDKGVLYSRNRGVGWKFGVVGLAGEQGYEHIAVDPQDPARLLVTARDGGIFKSVDSGLSWTATSSGLPSPPGADFLNLDPRTDALHRGRAFVSVPGAGLFSSADAGGFWGPFHTGIFPPAVLCLELATGNSDRIYVGLSNGLLRHL